MTTPDQIVDDRQRLVERLDSFIAREQHVDGYVNGISYVDLKAWRAALASPSEGNKKVDERAATKAVADAISEIPASSSGSMEFVATTVGMKIGRRLVEKIAETAVNALASRPQEQPRTATGDGWWVQPEWAVNPAYPAELILTIGEGAIGCVYLREGTWRALVYREGANELAGVVGSGFPTREEAQASLITAVRPYPALSVSPAAPEGWQMVPIKPTEAMLAAGEATFVSGHTGTPVSSPDDVYRAMLAAAQIERGEHETPERGATYGGPLGPPEGVRTEPSSLRSGTNSALAPEQEK